MNKIRVNISVDKELKEESTKLFQKLGVDFSTAVSMFLTQALIHKGFPFRLLIDEPNEQTLAAFAEEKNMKSDKKTYKRYNNIKEFRKEIEKEISEE